MYKGRLWELTVFFMALMLLNVLFTLEQSIVATALLTVLLALAFYEAFGTDLK